MYIIKETDKVKDTAELKLPELEVNELGEIEGGERVAEPNLDVIERLSREALVELNLADELGTSTQELTNKPIDELGNRRPLTLEERAEIQEKTNMSDETLDKCLIDENGKVYLKCINEEYAGTVHEGVRYERKTIEINGVEIEVVVPEFDSDFDVQLPDEKILASDTAQSRECNLQLKEAIANDPELRAQFTDRQLAMIEKGHTPSGYTWHHDAETGKMQLVRSDEHMRARHTGGKAIWGGGQQYR